MKFRITDTIEPKDENSILNRLREYNLERIEDKNSKDLGIYYESDSGDILGGLIGDTHGNWMTVKYLWVNGDLRSRGIGSNLLDQAEATAKERGCKYAFLDTFSFQAPTFYERKGYKEVFMLDDYPISSKRFYYVKSL